MWLLFGYFSLNVRVSLGFRQAHNLKVAGSNPAPATNTIENTHTAIPPDGGFFLRSKLLPLCKKAQCSAQAFVTFRLAHINLLGSCLNLRSWIGVRGAGYQPIYSFLATLI